jgi:SOS response regulatory protein OraA/RecX
MEVTCYSYLINLLNKKDYSTQELISKATTKGYFDPELSETIERLINLKFLNDTRLAENLIEWNQKSKGKNWLIQKLKSRKIPNDIIEETLLSLNEPDYSELSRMINSKLRVTSLIGLDQKSYLKAYRLILTKGYENPGQIIKNLQNEELNN